MVSGLDAQGLHNAALRIARRCRYIIQTCLREEEWRDCDVEFEQVIFQGLQELVEVDHDVDPKGGG